MRLRRDKRELWPLQFQANFQAWADAVGAPPWGLAPHKFHPLQPDRMILQFDPDQWRERWLPFLRGNRFETWTAAIKDHEQIEDTFIATGWREAVPFASLQAIAHIGGWKRFLEVDFDIGNPGFGLVPLVVHGAEVLSHIVSKATGRPHVTNPYRMRRLLMRRGIIPAKVGWND